MVQVSPAVHVPVHSSRQVTLHSVTLEHATLQPGEVPHMTSQLAPAMHVQLDPLHPHATPTHIGEAVGPQATAMAATSATKIMGRHMPRTLSRHGSLAPLST